MGILKTVELADFAEKNAKRTGIECSTERIEAIAIQCTFVMPIPREENLHSVIVFSNAFENFFIHETMPSAIFQKFGFRSLGSLPFSEEPKRTRP